jgi:hypothetical protein
MMEQFVEFIELGDGNLMMQISPEGIARMEEMKEEGKGYQEIMSTLTEHECCNGYHNVLPEEIGALTDSLIFSDTIFDDETAPEDRESAKVWWFPEYELVNELDEFKEKGFVIYTKAA